MDKVKNFSLTIALYDGPAQSYDISYTHYGNIHRTFINADAIRAFVIKEKGLKYNGLYRDAIANPLSDAWLRRAEYTMVKEVLLDMLDTYHDRHLQHVSERFSALYNHWYRIDTKVDEGIRSNDPLAHSISNSLDRLLAMTEQFALRTKN